MEIWEENFFFFFLNHIKTNFFISGGKSPVRPKRHIQISNVSLKATVYIKVFAQTDQSAKNAIRALENSLESAYQEKTVDDDLIKDLSKPQV